MARTDDHTADPIPRQPGEKYRGRTEDQWHAYWQAEFSAEEKRNREWRKQADQVTKRFLDKRKDQGPQYNIGSAEFRVNLFYSNTFIQMAFLYGQTPKVDVTRRFGDANDDVARVAANILERMLNTSVEANGGDFDTTIWANLQDHLVPGLGVARVRYEFASHEEVEANAVLDPETGEELAAEVKRTVIDYEDAPLQYVNWRHFHWGHAGMWVDVPWVAYDVYLTREQADRRFGPLKGRSLTYKQHNIGNEEFDTNNPDLADPAKTALIKEIWDSKTLSAQWYHEDYPGMLDIQDDPLRLEGFFPTPPPFIANTSTDLFYPTSYFMLAQDLYNEVDQLSTRINIITNAVRVGGVYDATYSDELRNALSSIENDLIPVKNWAQLAERGGLDKIVDFFPTMEIAQVLDKLREMRVEAINLLYQVNGLSDILRGSGEKYEGVGKARLKAQIGSVRVRALQTALECWASQLLSLKAEVICKHFDAETIIEQSNISFSHDATDPNLIVQAIQLLKNYGASLWRIRIKPDSMAMIDWEVMKNDRSEFLTALATYLQSAAPLMEAMPQSVPAVMELLKFGLAGFKGSEEIETVLDQAIANATKTLSQPQPQQPSPEERKSRLKLVETQTKTQGDMAKEAQKHRNEMRKIAAESAARAQEITQETESAVVQEVVQADQAIREIQAKQDTAE